MPPRAGRPTRGRPPRATRLSSGPAPAHAADCRSGSTARSRRRHSPVPHRSSLNLSQSASRRKRILVSKTSQPVNPNVRAVPMRIQQLPVSSITPSRRNPRRHLVGVDELAGSLETHGLLQPIVVKPINGGYEVVAGNRRFAAAQQLGWKTIPATVRAEAHDDDYVLALVENLQRQDLTAREEADALGELVRERGWSTRRVAEAIQRSQAFVSKRLRVFEDPMLAPAVLANEL